MKYSYSIITCAKWWIVRKLKKYLVKTKVFWKIEWFFKSDSTPLCIVRPYGGIDSICLAFTMAIYFPSEMVSTISLPIQKLVDFSFSNCVKNEISPRCNCLWEEGRRDADLTNLGFFDIECIVSLISSIFLLVVESWNRQHQGQTLNSTEKLISMNLFKILCVVTWAW